MKQFLSLFSGIGGSAFGAKAAGYQLLGAIEFDKQIADLYHQNHQSLVAINDVRNIKPENLPRRTTNTLCIQLSPPCQDWSGANCHANPNSDRALALDNCYHILEHYQPEQIIIENVRAYQSAPPMDRLREWLVKNGYKYIEQIINCADLGLSQTRVRYFLIATKLGMALKPVPLTHSRELDKQIDLFAPIKKQWIGWYEAIADLISSMSITELSNNQRLAISAKYGMDALLIDSRTRIKGCEDRFSVEQKNDPAITVLAGSAKSKVLPKLLIPTIGYHGDLPPTYSELQPAPTVKAMMMSDGGRSGRKGCWRINDGFEVREMSVRALARLQSFPDDLILSGQNSLDCKGVGNAVPPLVMQRILENCFI
jgi:DNA (cytosine-5)-methyltransferase 1